MYKGMSKVIWKFNKVKDIENKLLLQGNIKIDKNIQQGNGYWIKIAYTTKCQKW